MGSKPGIPLPSLRRLPIYYRHLLRAIETGQAIISSEELGASADVPGAQVRKDLSFLRETGRPGVGYNVRSLATYLENFLGLVNDKEAILVGVGNLGRALVSYPGFARYGLQIVALFDTDPAKIGQSFAEHEVLPVEKMPDLVRLLHIQMGIITVPVQAAQQVADAMMAGGIKVIWSFAPCHLQVLPDVLVEYEDLAAKLATLSHYLTRSGAAAGQDQG